MREFCLTEESGKVSDKRDKPEMNFFEGLCVIIIGRVFQAVPKKKHFELAEC